MIILLNGPPRSGKDTLAEIIEHENRTFLREKFASHLKELTHLMFCVPSKHDFYEDIKDKPNDDFNGMTPRQAYIWVDKKVLRPNFGEAYLGEALIERMRYNGCNYVISDSGFQKEAWPLIDFVGPHNLAVVHIKRKGCDFSGDSRGYWTLPGVRLETIENNGSKAALEKKAVKLLNSLGLQ